MKQKVISREYKVMLKSKRFIGPRSSLVERAESFWKEFKGAVKSVVLDTGGKLHKLEQRTIRFYDTPARHLYEKDYIFRERIESDSGEREVTLKFRHPDRYVSEDRDMTALTRRANEIRRRHQTAFH